MKNLIFSIGLLLIVHSAGAIEIKRLEPAFWWTGMKNSELQIMVYGKDVAKCRVKLNYAGVKVIEVTPAENPNYLFIYLDIKASAKPGTMNIEFIEGTEKYIYSYTLNERQNSGGIAGFNSKDVIYLITPDRFANGDPGNDIMDNVQTNRQQANSRHGGDLLGIDQHLDYIRDLGFTAFWLNPVLENKIPGGSYHGYAITDYYKVDPRFGSNEYYCSLVQNAHSKGIKVVMDMIFNHCGISHWWMNDLPSKDWINSSGKYVQTNHYKLTLLDTHSPKSEITTLVDGWFSRGMPDLNQRNPHLAKYLIQNSIWWIEYSRIDGIRQDTHFYADYDFMAEWCKRIEEEYPQFNIVGEVWYNQGAALAWWQRNSILNNRNTNLETVMDFQLTFAIQRVFNDESGYGRNGGPGISEIYEVIAQDFLYPDPDNILTFLNNHDMGRFTRKDEMDLKRYKQALAFLLTTRGIPQIYYGTEILISGTKQEGDGQIRKDFPGGWAGDSVNAFIALGRTPLQNEAWSYMQKLLQWRKVTPAVTEGSLVHYTPDRSNVYVYARKKDDQTVLVILNGDNSDKTIQMERFLEVTGNNTSGRDLITGNNVDIQTSVDIPGKGVYILELSK